jgi:flavin-dependent dehydrogenase
MTRISSIRPGGRHLARQTARPVGDSPNSADVAIIGGGPAGAATALLTARAGISTLLLECSDGQTQRIGETLPPVANRLLHELSLWEVFSSRRHHVSEGVLSAWTDEEVKRNDFFLSAQGPGWNLDRNRFDAMLLHAAESAGAVVCAPSKLLSCLRAADQRWLLEFAKNGQKHRVKVQYLVDATGKSGAGALQGLSPRLVLDRLIGIAAFVRCADTCCYTIVEAVDDGWFYSASLPQGCFAVVYFTDSDIYSAKHKENPDYWSSQLKKTHYIRDRLGKAGVPRELTIVSAATTRRVQFSGDGWIAVGDAAQSFDPLSSLGIYKALDSASRACDFLVNGRNGKARDASYAHWSEQVFRSYRRQRAEHYRIQRRWSGSQFWDRRRTV